MLVLDVIKLMMVGNKDFDVVVKFFIGIFGVVFKLQKLMESILGDSGMLVIKIKGLQDSLKIVIDQQIVVNDWL